MAQSSKAIHYPCERCGETAVTRGARPAAIAPDSPYRPELAEAFRRGARKIAADALDGKLEVRDGALVAETDGDGVLVQCWLYVHDMERAPMLGEDYAIEPQRDIFKGEPEGEDGSTCYEYCNEADAEIFAVFDVREELGAGPSLIEDFPTRDAAEAFIERLRAGLATPTEATSA